MSPLRTIALGLAVTHFFFSFSLLAEPQRFVYRAINPQLFAMFHLSAFILFALKKHVAGAALSLAVFVYYWLIVKPLAPIAEPQSVGLIAPSLVLIFLSNTRFTRSVFTLIEPRISLPSLTATLLRLGVAYPFIEWGLDALRNPEAFYTYIMNNQYATLVATPIGLQKGTFLLGLFEITLGVALSLGVATRLLSAISVFCLALFSVAVGYPLALPQNLAVAATALPILRGGGGIYSVDFLFSRKFLLKRTNSSS